MSKDFLREVILAKQKTLKEAKRRYPEEELCKNLEAPQIYRPFQVAISRPGKLSVIAEIKKASPSQGLLRDKFDPIQIARVYRHCGSSAISVLTEGKYFLGKLSYLKQVRKIVDIPLLRKDFIFDKYQLYESKFFGADCVLLIAELLGNGKLAEFLSLAKRLELDCLVEVNKLSELKYALDQGSQIIGINNRNLHTLELDNRSGSALVKHIPLGKVIVLESGIKTHSDYTACAKLNVNAVLIGSAFMKAEDIKNKFRDIVSGRRLKKKTGRPCKKNSGYAKKK